MWQSVACVFPGHLNMRACLSSDKMAFGCWLLADWLTGCWLPADSHRITSASCIYLLIVSQRCGCACAGNVGLHTDHPCLRLQCWSAQTTHVCTVDVVCQSYACVMLLDIVFVVALSCTSESFITKLTLTTNVCYPVQHQRAA